MVESESCLFTGKKRKRAELRDKLFKYLSENSCVDCGEKDPIVLQFDHVSGIKIKNVSDMIGSAASWSSILLEIRKCDIVCANCHLKRTSKTQNWHKQKKQDGSYGEKL